MSIDRHPNFPSGIEKQHDILKFGAVFPTAFSVGYF
jgi:hypothetical protein